MTEDVFPVSYCTFVCVEKIQRESTYKASSAIPIFKINFGVQVASRSLFCSGLLVFIIIGLLSLKQVNNRHDGSVV